MNFNEKELFGAALIGFDLIDGPVVRWTKSLQASKGTLNLDDFAMNFYLAFRGGNGGKKPRAILYDDFYIVAFPKDLELCCLFMKPQGVEQNITQHNKISSRMITDMEIDEDCDDSDLVCQSCLEGQVVDRCLCGGVAQVSGYCCSDVWQSSPCRVSEGAILSLEPVSGIYDIDETFFIS